MCKPAAPDEAQGVIADCAASTVGTVGIYLQPAPRDPEIDTQVG